MFATTIGPLKSSPVIKRHPANPILSAADIPYPATLIFNPGVTRFQGRPMPWFAWPPLT